MVITTDPLLSHALAQCLYTFRGGICVLLQLLLLLVRLYLGCAAMAKERMLAFLKTVDPNIRTEERPDSWYEPVLQKLDVL